MGKVHIVFVPGYFLFLRTGDPLLENTNHFDFTILIIQEDPGHEVANKYGRMGDYKWVIKIKSSDVSKLHGQARALTVYNLFTVAVLEAFQNI